MARRREYVGGAWTGWLFSTLGTLGFDVAELTKGLPGAEHHGPFAPLEIGSIRRLYHRVDREAMDPLLGFRLSQHFDEGATGFLMPLLWHSPTLGDALDNIVSYQWALSENGGFTRSLFSDSSSDGNYCSFEYIPVYNPIAANRHQILLLACSVILTTRRIMRHHCDVTRLNVPRSLKAARIGSALKCECKPTDGNLSIIFNENDLQIPIFGRDPAFYSTVLEYAKKLGTARAHRLGLVAEIKQQIYHYGFSRATIEDMERELAIHRRTLQRVLGENQLSFRSLKQEVIRDKAVECLASGNCTIAETAELLGYSETSAFHRAFIQWFNKTPTEFVASESQTYIPMQMKSP